MNIKISVIIPVFNNDETLKATLNSLKKQIFSDFEALIINNGSIDKSQRIIDQICLEDYRFFDLGINEKIGVAAARNIGIENAKGKYISFLDGDDKLPKNALNAMFEVMEKQDADMAVGNMLRSSPIKKSEFKVNALLASKNNIDKNDINFIYSFTNCNKMFKNEIIKNNKIRYENLTHAEDGVFLFSYLRYCKKICGCNEIVYEYYKPLPYMGNSATTNIKKGMIKDLCIAIDRIIIINKDKSDDYLREIYVRAIRTSLIGEYYRKLRILDEETFLLMKSKIYEYKKHITQDQWKKIVETNKDLQLDKGILSKEEAEKNPIITVAITHRVSDKHKETLIKSLYCQESPFFKIIEEKNLENGFMRHALLNCGTPYITFADSDIYYAERTLRNMHKTLVNNEY